MKISLQVFLFRRIDGRNRGKLLLMSMKVFSPFLKILCLKPSLDISENFTEKKGEAGNLEDGSQTDLPRAAEADVP